MGELQMWIEDDMRDTRPQRGGWAPGWYTDTCLTCAKEFMGDKRACQCANCAYRKGRENWLQKFVVFGVLYWSLFAIFYIIREYR